ncbi:MAG: glycosyltransferase family 4 protein [Cytophagales bacterium]|nr:glycosyltransferase family 4 protein [Rhizobacter sp.]
MNLVLLTHPPFLGSHSQAHFARMLVEAYRARGHTVSLRQPQPLVHRFVPAGRLSKWAGYVDQYLVFPAQLRAAMAGDPADTLYVLCDQALGPWVPQLAHRPHVVHCHDLLALRSALGDLPENPTSLTGRVYQRYIRRGFRHARHFISISQKSRDDLHRHGGVKPVTSEVVYNGLNHPYRPLAPGAARTMFAQAGLPADERPCLLHIGGGQWYKNTPGVVRLYASYASEALRQGALPLPLWMVSPSPNEAVQRALSHVPPQAEVRFFSGVANEFVEALYSHAAALLFPSLAEGFGWPIAEAMACGCPVITTGEAPMTEVGGDVAIYLPRLQHDDDVAAWAQAGAVRLSQVLARSVAERHACATAGLAWATRFDPHAAVDQYLAVYERVLAIERGAETSRTKACT